MATREELMDALRRADAAGDAAAAQAIARRVSTMSAAPTTRQEKVAAGQPRKEESWGDWASKRGRDVVEGLGGLVGSIADVPGILRGEGFTNTIMDTAGKITGKPTPKIYQPSQDINPIASKAADKLKLQKPSEEDSDEGRKQRLTSDITKGAVAAAVPVAGTEGLIAQIAGGITGGASSGIARELGAPEWGQELAGLVGGIVPAGGASALKQVAGTAKELNPFGSGQQHANRRLQDAASNRQAAREAILDPTRPEPTPGTLPTMAEQARDPGLASFQRNFGHDPTELQTRQRENAQVRRDAVNTTIGPGNPKAVQQLAEDQAWTRQNELTRRQQRAQAREQAAQAQGATALTRVQARVAGVADRVAQRAQRLLDKRTGEVGKLVSPEASSEAIRPIFDKNYDDASNVTNAAYNTPALKNPYDIKMTPEHVQNLHDDILAKTDEFYGDSAGKPLEGTRAQIANLFDQIKDKTINSRTVQNINSGLARIAGDNKLTNPASAAFASGLRDVVNKHIGPYVPDNVKADLIVANHARREEGRIFERSKIAPNFRTKFGDPVVPNTELAGKLVDIGDRGATIANELIESVGKPAAEELLSGHMRRLAESGELTDKKVASFKPMLDKLDGVGKTVTALRDRIEANTRTAAKVEAIGKAQTKAQEIANAEALKRAENIGKTEVGQQKQEIAAFGKTPLGSTIGTPSKPVDVAHTISKLVSGEGTGPQMELFIKQISHDPLAMKGARKALAEHIDKFTLKTDDFNETGNRIPKGTKAIKAIDSVLERGGPLLDDTQKQVLGQIRQELADVEFARKGGKEKKVEFTDRSLPGSAVIARGVRFLMAHFTNKNKVDTLLQSAIMDPKIAAEMLKRPSPNRLNRLKRTIGAAGRGAVLAAQANQ